MGHCAADILPTAWLNAESILLKRFDSFSLFKQLE
jgi:hypothetical protein